MSDRRENLSFAGTKAGQDLVPGFTYEELQHEIWAELDAVFVLPPRLPGDLDYKQFMERYDCGEHVARKRMAKLVKEGKWQWQDVMDDNCHNGRIRVIRKIAG